MRQLWIISFDSVPNPWYRWGPFGMVIQPTCLLVWWLRGNACEPGSVSAPGLATCAPARTLSQHHRALWNVSWSSDSILGTKSDEKKWVSLIIFLADFFCTEIKEEEEKKVVNKSLSNFHFSNNSSSFLFMLESTQTTWKKSSNTKIP